MSRVPFPPPRADPPSTTHRSHRIVSHLHIAPSRATRRPRASGHHHGASPTNRRRFPHSHSHRRRRRRRRHRHRGTRDSTRLETKRTRERTRPLGSRARPTLTHARTHACIRIFIIRIHPRGTTLTDHDSPPRDSIAIGGAADFARAIVISGRGCRFDESRPVVESPTPDARDRSSRRSRGCARARMVSMSPVMTRGTMCKQ